jgi:hypothetical protein
MEKSAAGGVHRRSCRSYFSANGYAHATKAGGIGHSGGKLSCEDSAGLGKVVALLVTSGVYGVIRRPSYLGLLVNSLGWALAAP